MGAYEPVTMYHLQSARGRVSTHLVKPHFMHQVGSWAGGISQGNELEGADEL